MSLDPVSPHRPGGITALAVFFTLGAAIAATSAASLLFPGSWLEPMWRLNPRAHAAFGSLGGWAPALLAPVAAACGAAASGLWRLRRWGHRLAFGILAVNLLGDVANVALGTEPRAIVGVPVAGVLLLWLSTRGVRRAFEASPRPD